MNLLNTEKKKAKVAEKLIKVFADHTAGGEFYLYLNQEIWTAQTDTDFIDPEYCNPCKNYWDNLELSACWKNLMQHKPDQKLIDYCHENHEGIANKNNPNYHGVQTCKRKKCTFQSVTTWNHEIEKVDHDSYMDRVEGAYGNPDTITVVYDGNSACSTLGYNEFGGRDAFVSAIDNVIPEGYYVEYGTSWSLLIAPNF